ncbi:MAG TPA: hypothetical protein PKA00_03770 [Saprospiraceae bacterium]|nr:hypothetical protein [Saprospiraceae bacterium]HMQ81995.1 hypothetical protein [Saprospiraceae bacterium]
MSRFDTILRLKAECLIWVCCFISSLAPVLMSAQVSVSAALDKNELLIGDQTGLHVFVRYPKEASIDKVDLSGLRTVPEIEVLNTESLENKGDAGTLLLEKHLTITSFDSGYYFIPPVYVTYTLNGATKTDSTNELGLKITPLPVYQDSLRLMPIKDIIEEPKKIQDYWFWLLVLGIIGLLVLIIALANKRKDKIKEVGPIRIVPAHEQALERLQHLEHRKLWQQGQIKDYHTELTHIFREYLEKRYQIQALESTTDEILTQLQKAELEKSWQEKLRYILQTVDLVKFAKAQPPSSFHGEAMENVRAFIQHTKEEEASV